MTSELAPGTAFSADSRNEGSLQDVSDLDQLARLYRHSGVLLRAQGIRSEDVRFFASVLEAINGFTEGLAWLPIEIRGDVAPPRPDWPDDCWLEVGSFDEPGAPRKKDYGRTLFEAPWRGIWFDARSGLLKDARYVAKTAFEAAIHELGHITYARVGAEAAIRAAAQVVFGDSNPGRAVSSYATSSFPEFWAEATAAVNTTIWERDSLLDRQRLERFVKETNVRSDKPLI